MSEFLLKNESPSKSHIRSTMLPISVENEEASKLGLFVAVCNKPKGEATAAAGARGSKARAGPAHEPARWQAAEPGMERPQPIRLTLIYCCF